MPLMPKSVKYRKTQRGKNRGKASRGASVAFGEFGIKSLENGFITARQIESARVTARHYMGENGKLFLRIFPHKSNTKTAAETRMGKGKGEPNEWIAKVRPGTIIYEISGVAVEIAREAFRLQSYKLPVRTKMVSRRIG